jgi:hypothetical protein
MVSQGVGVDQVIGVTFSHGTRNRLTRHDLARFPGGTLFDRIGRVLCQTTCIPRKELYEAWEVARRVRRWCRGGRVVDVAGGHGLLAHVMLLLDDSSPQAVVVDPSPPESGATIHEALAAEWPRLRGRVEIASREVGDVTLDGTDVIVSSHACGALTDRVLEAAMAVHAPVAVLPCCHDLRTCEPGPLRGWLEGAMAIDAMRAVRLAAHGYHVRAQAIPSNITPKNRLLIGIPR